MSGPRPTSPWRAWLALVGFSFRRHLRVREMVWIALGLLVVAALGVYVFSEAVGWELTDRRPRRRRPAYGEYLTMLHYLRMLVSWPVGVDAAQRAVAGAVGTVLEHSGFAVFSRWVVIAVFLGYLMPLWTLSFATSSIGAEREGRSLHWLLTRPVPRPMLYLGKLLATLPWTLGFNLAGFALICYAAGPVGQRAFALYWPAVVAGTLAFTALFHLIGAVFRRPAVVALLYAFFIEALVGDLPGTLKRVSISYYSRCLMYHEAVGQGWELESATVFVPVSPATAWAVLLSAAAGLTLLGMAWFARAEYRDEAE